MSQIKMKNNIFMGLKDQMDSESIYFLSYFFWLLDEFAAFLLLINFYKMSTFAKNMKMI